MKDVYLFLKQFLIGIGIDVYFAAIVSIVFIIFILVSILHLSYTIYKKIMG